jgi:predicted DsbA family dithiol-disulfide isomerase
MPTHIHVWSDYVCPFCYLEEPVLEQIAHEFGDQVIIHWRAYELRPEPVPTLQPDGPYLKDIWARAVYPMAQERGMNLRLPPVQPRSRLAHESALFAGTRGRLAQMNHNIFRAFFEDGRDIGDPVVLADIGSSIGLDGEELVRGLKNGNHRPQVLADQQLAAKLQISGVPAMFIHRAGESLEQAVEMDGAQPFEYVRSGLVRLLAQKDY